jgi:hypothetical protein
VKIIMSNTSKKRITAGLAGMALALTATLVAAPAQAAEPPAEQAPPTAAAPLLGPVGTLTAAQSTEFEILLASTDATTGVFNAEQALAAGAPAPAVADYAAAFQASGQGVANVTPGLQAQATESGAQVAAAASCAGARGYTGFYGWGWQWALNSCDTDLLIAALAGGGGSIAAVGGLISAAGVTAPAGAVTAAAGGLVVAGAGVVGICKAASYDTKSIYLNSFVAGGIGCWGQ